LCQYTSIWKVFAVTKRISEFLRDGQVIQRREPTTLQTGSWFIVGCEEETVCVGWRLVDFERFCDDCILFVVQSCLVEVVEMGKMLQKMTAAKMVRLRIKMMLDGQALNSGIGL
jgi:hypothetical protein